MKIDDTLVWHYKDGNRQYYTVLAVAKAKIACATEYDPDYFEMQWTCEIYKDDSDFFPLYNVPHTQELIYTEDLQSQYDEPIKLNDILLAYSTYVAALCLGMAKFADKFPYKS